jgi:thioredoxin reductase (NADPH)
VPGENLPKTRHYFTSAHHLFNQKVAVIGASNSAIDVALEAYRKGADVTLLVRGRSISDSVKYWIRPDIDARIKEGSIRVFYGAHVNEISEKHISFSTGNQYIELQNDFVYAMTGYQPNFILSEELGIEIDEESGYPRYNEATMETNATNVYLAGVVIGGMNTRQWFIENSKDHSEKIISSILEKLKGEKLYKPSSLLSILPS